MKVEIDNKSGFCFGVVKAIERAEEAIESGEVYSLGDIVHNRVEVQRLQELGLVPIDHSKLRELSNATLLIRAHGEPPTTYSVAKERGLTVIDATCPVVARLQQRVKRAHQAMSEMGGTVVILGKKGHSEVVGLTGQVEEDVVVVESVEDLEELDFTKPIQLLSQTTQSLALFREISKEIVERSSEPESVVIEDTICRQVANREPHLREFARRYDVVIFVAGRKSSNGRVLYGVTLSENPKSYQVEDEGDLRSEWFEGVESVGICGATSTPMWLMERVAKACRAF